MGTVISRNDEVTVFAVENVKKCLAGVMPILLGMHQIDTVANSGSTVVAVTD